MKNPSVSVRSRLCDVRQKLRFFIVLTAAILSLLSLNSCIYKSAPPLSSKDIPFQARVVTGGFEADIEANVSVIPAADGSDSEFRFEFLSPASLGGLEAAVKGKTVEIRLGGQTFFDGSLAFDKSSGIFRICEMLAPSESVLSIKSGRGDECGFSQHERLTVVGTASFLIHIDPESGFPLKITDKASGAFLTVEIIKKGDAE